MSPRMSFLLLLAGGLAACAAPARVPPPSARYADDVPPMRLIEGPSVAPPVNDISESRRREWFDAQRPKAEYVPDEYVPEPARVERVYVRDYEPDRYVRSYDRYDGWYLPFSLSLGYWGGRGGRHRGWGWGLGWRGNWGW